MHIAVDLPALLSELVPVSKCQLADGLLVPCPQLAHSLIYHTHRLTGRSAELLTTILGRLERMLVCLMGRRNALRELFFRH